MCLLAVGVLGGGGGGGGGEGHLQSKVLDTFT